MKSKTPLIIGLIAIIIAAILAISYSQKSKKVNSEQASSSSNHQAEDGKGEKNNPSSGNTRYSKSASSNSTLKWKQKINDLLADDSILPKEAAPMLLEIASNNKVSETVRNDALEHALNLIDNKGFEQVQQIMETKDRKLPAPLVETILDDILNRTERIQITTALIAIKSPNAAIVEEAKELLEFHLEEEHGDDLHAWKNAGVKYINALKVEKSNN